jgi:putative transposase
MAGSFVSLHYHLAFSTKDRLPQITDDLRERLWAYMAGIARQERGVALCIGGTDDHVHLLVSLHQDIAPADFVRVVKSNSSRWVHETYPGRPFAWQEGYGAFSVSYMGSQAIRRYIAGQAEHHREKSFQEEFIEFLERHCIAYDARYIWR